MSEPIDEVVPVVAAEPVVPVVAAEPVVPVVQTVFDKLKALLIASGHDVEIEFEKLVELAKLLASK